MSNDPRTYISLNFFNINFVEAVRQFSTDQYGMPILASADGWTVNEAVSKCHSEWVERMKLSSIKTECINIKGSAAHPLETEAIKLATFEHLEFLLLEEFSQKGHLMGSFNFKMGKYHLILGKVNNHKFCQLYVKKEEKYFLFDSVSISFLRCIKKVWSEYARTYIKKCDKTVPHTKLGNMSQNLGFIKSFKKEHVFLSINLENLKKLYLLNRFLVYYSITK